MTAEQPSVEALVERVREALEYQERESLVGPLFPEALAALDSLTAALERAERERDTAQTALAACRMGEGEAMALVLSHEGHIAKLEARAQKAEAGWKELTAQADELVEKLGKAEAELKSIRAALAHPDVVDEPPTEQIPGAGQDGC